LPSQSGRSAGAKHVVSTFDEDEDASHLRLMQELSDYFLV
jgi:hypothetical protein